MAVFPGEIYEKVGILVGRVEGVFQRMDSFDERINEVSAQISDIDMKLDQLSKVTFRIQMIISFASAVGGGVLALVTSNIHWIFDAIRKAVS